MKGSTRFALLVVCVLLSYTCEESKPGVVFHEGRVMVGGHVLRLGATLAEWEAILGQYKVRKHGSNPFWPQHQLLAHVALTACGERRIVGVRVAFFGAEPPSLLGRFGQPVQLEECRFEAGDKLTGAHVDCGPCYMVVGMPFDWMYDCHALGVGLMATIRPDRRVNLIDYGVDEANQRRLGIGLEERQAAAFLKAGACDRDRHPLFGDEARAQDRRNWLEFAAGLWDALGNGTGWW